MSTINNILNTFEPITLSEMDSVKLLDRMDTKFTFNASKLPAFLNELKNDYKALDVCGIQMSRYETLYFDTPNLELYIKHHNGKQNRYKVRYRKYADSNINFFEVKFKTNKGRTIKNRVKRTEIHEEIQGKSTNLLNEKTPLQAELLKPVLWIYYTRITLVNKHSAERLTLDLNLNYKHDNDEIAYPALVIAEVKQDKSGTSPFISLMRKNHISDVSISKYCFGIISLYKGIKKNNFKEKLIEINKICHGNN